MSKIQWTDETENPIYLRREDGSHGGHWCRKISPGCANCYAEAINNGNRFDFASHLPYTGEPPSNLYFDQSILDRWQRARTPKKRFVCSMTDLFGEWVPQEWQHKVFDAAALAPTQTIQLLTKRPAIARDSVDAWCLANRQQQLPGNIWMGVSVEDNKTAGQRIPELFHVRAAIRWLSCEPLLEELYLQHWLRLKFIDLIVIGGESGINSRDCYIHWFESLLSQCSSTLVHAFVKQMGSRSYTRDYIGADHPLRWRDSKGGNPEEWLDHLRVRQLPLSEAERSAIRDRIEALL